MPDDEEKDSPPHGVQAAGASNAPVPSVDDKFRPEAIAARIDNIGEESDLDRVAREEEGKLSERKKTQKKKGLESAVSKRLAKIGEGKVKRPSALSGAPMSDADPLLARATKASEWIREHRQTFGAFVAVGLLGLAGLVGYDYWQEKRNADASAVLAEAMADEHGHVSAKDAADDDDTKAKPLYPTFKSADARRDAALAKYRSVESTYPGTGAAILARLAEGSLLLDSGDSKGAAAAFEDVKTSALAQADGEVRGRSLEGLGFADELLAQTDVASKDKHLGDALTQYQALERVDVNGFKELGLYHQARVLQAQGNKGKAIEALKDVQKRVSGPGESHPFSYLEFVAEDRLRELDPTALPPKAPKGAGGMSGPGGARSAGPGAMGGKPGGTGPGGLDMNDPQIQKLLEQLKKKGGGGPPPASPQ